MFFEGCNSETTTPEILARFPTHTTPCPRMRYGGNIMRNRQIRSALDGVVLILSAVLFTLLSLVSCKNELKPEASPLPPPPIGRNAAPPAEPSPVAVAGMQAPGSVQGGVEGGVVGGVIGSGRTEYITV